MTPLVGGLLAFGTGVALGSAAAWWWRGHARRGAGTAFPGEAPHVVDLLRRAHGGVAACVVAAGAEPVVSGEEAAAVPLLERAVAAARLAMEDGRRHVLRDGKVIVAAGDGELGMAVVLADEAPAASQIDALARELRQLLGELRAGVATPVRATTDRSTADWLAVAPQTVDGLAHALCQAVRSAAGRPAAIALRDPTTHVTEIVAVSHGGDRMLLGMTAAADSAVGRACAADIPVVAPSLEDLLGRTRVDRRARRAAGTAFPLRDGREGIGALIVFGESGALDPAALERVLWLTVDAGPRLASALAVRAAEGRALTDPLTGLPNRRALEQGMGRWAGAACSLLYVDIDHFKQFNDGHGHVAGDAALRHVARIFRRTLREDDLAARIGGEEFALWLPDTPLPRAVEVGERVRAGVSAAPLHWDGRDLQLTCSVGVASLPECVSHVANLFGAADAAVYEAKRAGRNRVHTSPPRGG